VNRRRLEIKFVLAKSARFGGEKTPFVPTLTTTKVYEALVQPRSAMHALSSFLSLRSLSRSKQNRITHWFRQFWINLVS
jgi:hypothetical protein